jgi:Calx-beta domain
MGRMRNDGGARRSGGWLALGVVMIGLVATAVLASSAPGRSVGLPWLAVLDTEGTNYQSDPSSMTFTVTLSSASAVPVSVDYATVDCSSPDNDDYEPAQGTLVFAPGEMEKKVEISLLPEPGTLTEFDELMCLDLSNPVNATLYKARAIGTIHFQGDPKPEQVNVTAVGDANQCVQTVNAPGCQPLDGEHQFDIEDIKYVNPGSGKINLHTTEGSVRFFGTAFDISKIDPESSGTGKPMTLLTLRGGSFAACGKTTRAAAGAGKTKKPKTVRRLWGKGQGSFRTRGRYSSGTVRGTWWLTSDRCDGTRTHVLQGVVSVYDFVLKKHVKVPAGSSYIAGPAKNH